MMSWPWHYSTRSGEQARQRAAQDPPGQQTGQAVEEPSKGQP